MEHVFVLLYVFALAAGSASIAFTSQLSREWRGKLLRVYVRFLVSLNVCVVLNLVAAYLENALGGFPPGGQGALTVLTDLAGMALVGVIVHQLGAVMRAVVDEPASPTYGRVILASLLVVAAAVVAAVIALPSPEIRSLSRAVTRAANLALIVAGVASIVPTILATQRLPERERGLVRRFASLHLVAFGTILLGFFVPSVVAWSLLLGALLLLNLIPLTLLRGYRAERLARHGSLAAMAASLDAFAARYRISSRELEVVVQALTGKTNSEISAALFISAATVKNHLHSVFQKCDVRNRVELASLAHRLAAADPGEVEEAP